MPHKAVRMSKVRNLEEAGSIQDEVVLQSALVGEGVIEGIREVTATDQQSARDLPWPNRNVFEDEVWPLSPGTYCACTVGA